MTTPRRPLPFLLVPAMLGIAIAAPAARAEAAVMVVSLSEMTAICHLLRRAEFRCGPDPRAACLGYALLEAEDGERRCRITARLLGRDRASITVQPAEPPAATTVAADDPGAAGEVPLDAEGSDGATLPLMLWNCPPAARIDGTATLLAPLLCPAPRILSVLRVGIRFAAAR
jgi:hypothetical protein